MMADVKALRALLDAATPGPWEVRGQVAGDGALRVEAVLKARGMRAAGDPYPAVCRLPRDYSMQHADAALIAGAVNALPELLDEVERLRVRAATVSRRAEEAEACESAVLDCLRSSAHKLWMLPPVDRTLATDAIWRDLAHFKPSDAGRALLDRLRAAESERDALRAEVERLKARRAEMCDCVHATGRIGETLAYVEADCHKCGGSGAVVVEGEK